MIEPVLILAVGAFVLVFVLFTMFVSMFKKVPANTAMIVVGALSREPRVVMGGATTVMPLIEKCSFLSLSILELDFKPTAGPSRDGIIVSAAGSCSVKVLADDAHIIIAAQNFLDKSAVDIANIALQVIETNFLRILPHYSLEQLQHNPQQFADNLNKEANLELEKLGLTMPTLLIKKFETTGKTVSAEQSIGNYLGQH